MRKRIITVVLTCCLIALAGCSINRPADHIAESEVIANAPTITGIVTEVHDKFIVIQGEPNELYYLSEEYHVSLPAEYENSDAGYCVGDEVIVYYDGNISESDPLQVNGVLAIEWKNHAGKTDISDSTTTVSEIPELSVTYNDTSFVAWRGGYDWIYANEDGTEAAITADSNHPLECVETIPFILICATTISHGVGYEPNQVTLQFEIEPDKLTVYRYDLDAIDDTEGEEIIMDNGFVLDLGFGN